MGAIVARQDNFHKTSQMGRLRGTRRTSSFGGRPRRARTFSDRIRTNGLTPSRSNDSGVSIRASPIRIPVFQRVANSIW
ncbi:porin [Escherichia coli O69:H11 str. 07-3763]|nr:porin [Escherichia coli O69:H11 str. 07-3763]